MVFDLVVETRVQVSSRVYFCYLETRRCSIGGPHEYQGPIGSRVFFKSHGGALARHMCCSTAERLDGPATHSNSWWLAKPAIPKVWNYNQILADCNSSMTVVSSLRDQSPMRSEEIGRVRSFKHIDRLLRTRLTVGIGRLFHCSSNFSYKVKFWYLVFNGWDREYLSVSGTCTCTGANIL